MSPRTEKSSCIRFLSEKKQIPLKLPLLPKRHFSLTEICFKK